MKRPTAIILMGIPASGKSTFYRERFFDTHVRISMDQLRSRERERIIREACLAARQPFASDNTNATREARERTINPARSAGFRIIGYYFSSKLRDALQRNRLRQGAGRIPDAGVMGVAGRLVLPSLSEGFDELWYVRMNQTGGFDVEPWEDESTPSPDEVSHET